MSETGDEWQGILEDIPTADIRSAAATGSLSAGEIPAWLQALKPRDLAPDKEVESEEPPETNGPLAGMRGVLHVAPAVTEPKAALTVDRYTIPKEQQQQIALLHQLTHEDQGKAKQVVHKKTTFLSLRGRLAVGAVLLLAVLLGLFLPILGVGLPATSLPPVSANARSAMDILNGLNDQVVLVAFDYSPAVAGEMDPLALMLMGQLARNGNRVLTISQAATGTALADQVIDRFNESDPLTHLESRSAGFLSGEAVGLRNLGSCLQTAGSCETLFGKTLDSAVQDDLANVALVVILSGDQNSLVNWIEQVESQNETLPMVAAVTQPLGPLTIPYWATGQLEGSIIGIPGAAAVERQLLGQSDGPANQLMNAQTVVRWIVIISLVAAALYYGLTGFVAGGQKKGGR
jgi:hypothetical protein